MTKGSQPRNRFPRGREKSITLEIENEELFQILAGEQSVNFRVISDELRVKVLHTADGLVVSGNDAGVDLAVDLLGQLQGVVASGLSIEPDDVRRSIDLLSSNREESVEQIFKTVVNISGGKFSLVPKTVTQKKMVKASLVSDVIIAEGPAGTGKTFLSIALAVAALQGKRVKRIVLCRPAVEAGEKLGFLPGDMAEKVNPYLRPMYDALFEILPVERIEEYLAKGTIEVAPLAFMRGRTLSHACVILDEAQNTTPVQMKMFLTRLGSGSQFFVTGDTSQIDLGRGQESGLVDGIKRLQGVEGVQLIRFDPKDVIRHPLVTRIIEAYES